MQITTLEIPQRTVNVGNGSQARKELVKAGCRDVDNRLKEFYAYGVTKWTDPFGRFTLTVRNVG